MTLSKLAAAVLLTTIVLPGAAFARPGPKLAASVVERRCERNPTCVARLYADLLAAPDASARELHLDAVAVFPRGADRLRSADSTRISELADAWKLDSSWTTITVEGYADRPALAQQRADKVKTDLVNNGVDPAFIVAVGRTAHSSSRGCVDLKISLGVPTLTTSMLDL